MYCMCIKYDALMSISQIGFIISFTPILKHLFSFSSYSNFFQDLHFVETQDLV